MNKGEFNEFIARLDEICMRLEQIEMNTMSKHPPPKSRKTAQKRRAPASNGVGPKSGKNAATRRK